MRRNSNTMLGGDSSWHKGRHGKLLAKVLEHKLREPT